MIIQIEPWIDNEELIQLKRIFKTRYVTENILTEEFEELIKKLTKAKYAIAYNNGTLATYAIINALGIGKGDEVIIPNMTFISTANSIILSGAKPVLCDINKNTFCIDFEKAKSLVTSKTKAIMPVHLYGQSADMVECKKFAKKYKLKIIEDAAQGIGVKYKKRHVGTFGEAGVLSFYGNKIITCGEGGIILTNNSQLAKKCYALKNHGRNKKGIFIHDEIGYNFAFTEMQAAIGISQMKKLDRIKKRKHKINKLYKKNLKKINEVKECFIDKNTDPLYWFTSFLFTDARKLQNFLIKKKIQTRRFFYSLHLQPCYLKKKQLVGNMNGNFTNTINIYNSGLSLPSSYVLKDSQVNTVCSFIKDFYNV
tara:strand:+ start:4176 stop:5276 length:1101 start_codon:yes stop_codon:yes gene_type:complete